jgi:hypothetical protein
MSAVVKVKVGDTGFRLRGRIFEDVELGTPMDLTDRDVELYAHAKGAAENKIDGAACAVEDQAAPETKGYFHYDFQAADLDTVGTFEGEVKVLTGDAPVSIPRQGFFTLIVSRSLA